MGEFYTPVEYAKKALNYIEKTIGKWREDENYRLWDMSAGTGNLEFPLPSEALDKCYISTLLENAAEIKRRFRKSENKMDCLYESSFCDKQ
ncbi:MAG: YbjN domain-containing protein [Elusimicrobiota bacterium]|jgi:hypothetical protein|nr:YbjN domain-containing protein [Elusimicrobiota bacterium]